MVSKGAAIMKEPFDFGANLQQLRKAKGLTQSQLGRLTGVSASAISGYEINTTRPSLEALAALAVALGGDLNQMLGIKQPQHKTIIVDGLSDRQLAALEILIDELKR